jgi:hypothetical protein
MRDWEVDCAEPDAVHLPQKYRTDTGASTSPGTGYSAAATALSPAGCSAPPDIRAISSFPGDALRRPALLGWWIRR